jgi:hypothetical protein
LQEESVIFLTSYRNFPEPLMRAGALSTNHENEKAIFGGGEGN